MIVAFPVYRHLYVYVVSSYENLANIIEGFNSTSRYFHDVLNIGNVYFEQMVYKIYRN